MSGELRTFSFVAQSLQDGTARGEAQINNRMVGEVFQVEIDCLQVFDNTAIMSGVITRHRYDGDRIDWNLRRDRQRRGRDRSR